MATSPNKRLKTLTSASQPNPLSQPIHIFKGKSKVEEGASPLIVENESSDCCGICLSEAAAGISRGFIDSCNHYYCFVCIMEWAKVESKCPLCKRRFSTIRRPPKPPVFTSERVVHVPVCDQVYHYYGNATIGPPNPYSEVKCGVCFSVADESLILLCDLCDSATHTYCVGLGVTVPEGDWYCQDCMLLRDEQLKSESNVDSGIQMSFGTVQKTLSTNEQVSVSNIIQESCGSEVQRSRNTSSVPCSLPPRTCTDNETTMIHNINRSSSTNLEIVTQHPTKPNTRTLQHCRNLHDRIRVLRDNWNGFQRGVLSFSSNPGNGNISNQKSLTCKGGKPSISCLNQQSVAQCSFDLTNEIGAHEIQKAWKMMDKAKSIKQERGRSSIVHQAAQCPIRKLNTIKNADYTSLGHLSTDSQQNGAKNVGNLLPGQCPYCALGKDCNEQLSTVSGIGEGKTHVAKDVTYCCKGSISGHTPTHQDLEFSKGVQTPLCVYDASIKSEKLSADKTLKGPHSLSPAAVSELVILNINQIKEVDHASSSDSKEKHCKEKSKLEKIYVNSQQYNDAKSEIQSLVKLNLKLQTKEEKLEVNAFKEVARLATHAILAACGLEHPQPGCDPVPGSICSHPSEIQQLQKSSLMPYSCRECFYVFVKDMVNKVMLQKKRTQKNP